MNVQTEKLDNHVARLTVAVDVAQLEKAKKKAARRLAKHVNIPGFRKGKAPYRILVNYVGEGAIIEEAIEELGNDVYKKALVESRVEPYTIGELEDFKLEPQPTFVFTVPMQPTVDMGDYRNVRVDYEAPEVEDKDVDDALRRLQEEHALVEQSQRPAQMGDRITADVHGFFTNEDEDEADEETEDDAADAAEAQQDAEPDVDEDDDDYDDDDDHDEDFHNAPIHQHEAVLYLDEDREPLPGFAAALVGAEEGGTVEFKLTYPEDEDRYGEFSGREVRFVIEIDMVENVTLPALNDDFAARVTEEEEEENEDEPLTLLQLRARLRENIENAAKEQYSSQYVELVMDEMVEVATFSYPEAMITNQIDDMLESAARRFNVSLEDYFRLTQQDPEALHADENYRESAKKYIERSLVMRGVLDEEELTVTDNQIEEEINRVLSQFGEQAESFRSLFDTPDMRNNVTNNLLEQQITDRIVAIGKGEAPPPHQTAEPAAEAAAPTDSEPTAEDESAADDEPSDTPASPEQTTATTPSTGDAQHEETNN